MNLVRYGFLLAALGAVACGGGDDDRPKKAPPLGSSGGRNGTGGRVGSGGSKSSGGTEGDGGPTETGGAGGGSGGASGGSGGASETGGAGGAGGSAVVEPTCTLSTGNEICDGCIQSDCSFQCAACEGNEECAAMVECVLTTCTAGFTGKCVSDCSSLHPAGSDHFNDVVFNCGKPACSTFCPFVR